jgi:S1-C subfamily serine protease
MARSLAITASLAAAAVAIGIGTYALVSSPGGTKTTTVVRQVTVAGPQPTASTSSLSVTDVYDKASKGVVEITVGSTSSSFPLGPRDQQAQGSGFVYDGAGHIVTNEHVVDGAESISVRFWNGQTSKATLVGTDPSTDLAVIKVNAPSSLLQPLTLADSSDVQVGEGVVAIGSPFGLEGTVTAGIVSALHRQMTAPNNFTITDSIQTDAAINHGNSGGPLLDLTGKVIGVNSQIESDSGDNAGVGFAIPSNTVESIVSQLVSSGDVQHAYLGVAVATIPDSIASQLNIPAGVEVTEVRSGTPADKAGLHASTGSSPVAGQGYPTGGDVITAIDGKKVTEAAELQSAIDAKRPGDTVSVTYVRDGKTKTVEVKLAVRPS